ncbi:MAG: tripartite tricarboxylate transporter substrate binding protein [Burkholderiales bacterium]|nr:tripartite tricarboxylate transporter substrate binding protein [Burkholderiales bacterium]
MRVEHGKAIYRCCRRIGCVWFMPLVMFGIALPAAGADWKPERTAELITTAASGGNLDIAARAIQKIWQDNKIGPVTEIINKPGGSGGIALVYLNQHSASPHHLLTLSMTPFAGNAMGRFNFAHTDVSAISLLFSQYIYISVRKDSPIKDGKDLIARLRADPGSLSVAIATSIGNAIHMGIASPMKAAGVEVRKMRVVAFKSSGVSMTNLLGGHVDVVASTFGTLLPHLEAGRVRVLGFSGPERLPGALASVPTWREQGADATLSNWFAIVGAKGIRPAQIAYWENAFSALDKTDEWRADLSKNFRVSTLLNSRQTQEFLARQQTEIRDILVELGLTK